MKQKYLDDNGQVMMVVSSTAPGITIVPLGKTIEEAIPITDKQYEKHLKDEKKNTKVVQQPSEVGTLTKELGDLKLEVEKLKKKDVPTNKQ